MTEKQSKRRRFQFGLRSALGLILVFAIVMFTWVGPAMKQRRVGRLLRANNFSVEYSSKPWYVPQKLFEVMGSDYFTRITHVESQPVTQLNRFPFIKNLKIPHGDPVGSLNGIFPNLNSVELRNPQSVASLVDLKNLELLRDAKFRSQPYPLLPRIKTLDVGLATKSFDCHHLASFPSLEVLLIRTECHNEHLIGKAQELKLLRIGTYSHSGVPLQLDGVGELQQLASLTINGCDVPDLTPIQQLPKLETLRLEGKTEADLTPLLKMTQLRHLTLSGVFPDDEVDALRDALPDCLIFVN